LDALIGAPIFTSLYCPSYSKEIALSDCKNIGLAGLVYQGAPVTINAQGFLSFNFVKPPTDYSDAAIAEYANQLGVSNVLEISKRLVGSANKAEETIVSTFGFSESVARMIINYMVTWYPDWQKTYNEARPYAEQAKAAIEKARNRLNQMKKYEFLNRVEECLAEAIGDIEPLEYWYADTINCALERVALRSLKPKRRQRV
jgi:hypothetical protein|nr:hypothetical protein [Candidatus Aramenus sulfurataquae]